MKKKPRFLKSVISAILITCIFITSSTTMAFAATTHSTDAKGSHVKVTKKMSSLSASSAFYYIPDGGVMYYRNNHGTIRSYNNGSSEEFVASPVLFLTASQARDYYNEYLNNHVETSPMKDIALFLAGIGAPSVPVVGQYLAGGLIIYTGIDLANRSYADFIVSQMKQCVDNHDGMEIYTEQVITGRNQGDGTFEIINPWNGPYADNPASEDEPIEMDMSN